MRKQIVLMLFSLTLYQCGSPKVIEHDYAPKKVDPSNDFYGVFNCTQLYSEARQVSTRINELAVEYDKDTGQSRLRFFGSVLYWPILLLSNDQSSKELLLEYGRLEGRINKLNHWLEQKGCRLEDE